MTHTGVLALFLTLVWTPIIYAQGLAPGHRIRLTFTAGSAPAISRVDSVRPGQLWVSSPGLPSRNLDLGGVRAIERSEGRKPSIGKGLLLGALGGVVAGGLLYAVTADEYMKDDSSVWIPVFMGSGLAGGALLGTGLSLVLARERWSIVPPEQWAKNSSGWSIGLRKRVY